MIHLSLFYQNFTFTSNLNFDIDIDTDTCGRKKCG
jgi:hypothetical protein